MKRKNNSPLEEKEITSDQLVFLYCVLFISFIAVSVIFAVASNGKSWTGMLFHTGKYTDWFMDFFNSLRDSVASNVYSERNSIYPPLAVAFFRFLGRMLPSDVMALDQRHRYEVQENQLCVMMYLLYAIAIITFLYRCISRHVFDKNNRIMCEIFSFITIVSYPVMYGLERGNIVVMAVVLTVFFVFYKDSESKFIRECAYISLAFAAGIKVYPALFGLLLIFEKKYKQAGKLIVYGILAVVVPLILINVIPAPLQTSNDIIHQQRAQTLVDNNGEADNEIDEQYEAYDSTYTDLIGQELEPSDEISFESILQNLENFMNKKSNILNLSSVSVKNIFMLMTKLDYFVNYAIDGGVNNGTVIKICKIVAPVLDAIDWSTLADVFMYITEAVCIFLLFVLKKNWQRTFLMCYLFLNIPTFSSSYSLMFLLIPIVMFLFDTDGKRTKSDIFIAVMFILMMAPIPTFWVFNELSVKYISYIYFDITYNSKVNQWLATPAFQAVFISLIVTGISELKKQKKGKTKTEKDSVVVSAEA